MIKLLNCGLHFDYKILVKVLLRCYLIKGLKLRIIFGGKLNLHLERAEFMLLII